MRTAIGFRAHSGWAAMVAVAGSVDTLRVLDRRRIVIADPTLPGSKQPYHAAESLSLPEADGLVRNAIESSRGLACEAIAAALHSLRSQHHEIVACGIVLGSGKGSGKPLPALETILASHALIHTAEGQMFRDILQSAARANRLPVTGVYEKDFAPTALNKIDTLGKLIGPPWTQDQKYATLVALIALTK